MAPFAMRTGAIGKLFRALGKFQFPEAEIRIIVSQVERGRPRMLDAATTALLRAVLDEVCKNLSPYETGVRAHVASKILEAASRGETTHDALEQVGREALSRLPTMWR